MTEITHWCSAYGRLAILLRLERMATIMDTQGIIQQLRAERDRINSAIEALEESNSSSAPRAHAKGPKKRGGISAAGRRKLSQMMKARWAARRKADGKKK